MERRNGKLIISSAGGTASSTSKTYKVSLPSTWINSLELNQDNRDIELSFDGEKIIIEPKASVEKFIDLAKKKCHRLLMLNYYNNDDICTVIIADYNSKKIRFENCSDNPIETAFGVNQIPTWEDYENFLLERCIPEERDGLKEYLTSIGVDEFGPLEIIKKTQGRMAEDNQWIEVKECL